MIEDGIVKLTFDTRPLTPSASPWTYTAGDTVETLFIETSGVIQSVETLGAKVNPTVGAQTQSITLIPGQSVVVHFTGELKGESTVSRDAPTDDDRLAWASFNLSAAG